ncbi:hypothetical protein GCM10027187_59880 [Streptosporangium sandarakinum]
MHRHDHARPGAEPRDAQRAAGDRDLAEDGTHSAHRLTTLSSEPRFRPVCHPGHHPVITIPRKAASEDSRRCAVRSGHEVLKVTAVRLRPPGRAIGASPALVTVKRLVTVKTARDHETARDREDRS